MDPKYSVTLRLKCIINSFQIQRENYPETFSHVQDKQSSVEEYCRYIEEKEGREPINVVKAIAPLFPDDPVTYSKPIRVRRKYRNFSL